MQLQVEPGITLTCRVVGDGPRDVLCVHGWMMSGAVFDPILPALGRGRRIAVPDLRGAGGSSRPDGGYDLARLAADLWAVVERVGLVRPAIVGHSMGGQLAQYLAADRPDAVSALVLLNPVPASGLPLPADAMGLFATSAGDPARQGAILDMACLQLPASERARLLQIAGAVAPQAIVQTLTAWTAGGFADRLGRITARTEVVATSDPFLPPAFLQAEVVDRIAGARLHVLEGPGHYPQCEAPERVAALLEDLL